jgi:hypothetical protein
MHKKEEDGPPLADYHGEGIWCLVGSATRRRMGGAASAGSKTGGGDVEDNRVDIRNANGDLSGRPWQSHADEDMLA